MIIIIDYLKNIFIKILNIFNLLEFNLMKIVLNILK